MGENKKLKLPETLSFPSAVFCKLPFLMLGTVIMRIQGCEVKVVFLVDCDELASHLGKLQCFCCDLM